MIAECAHRVVVRDQAWRILLKQDTPAPLPEDGAGLELYRRAPLGPGHSYVMAQVGQSLDGRVATAAGDARDVSGQEGIRHLHRLRALADAVIVGVGTVLHDDPRLTVRQVPGANPVRVVIDPSGRAPDCARMLQDDGARRIVIQAVERPRPAGVEVIHLASTDGGIPPRDIVDALLARGLRRLLVEGGAKTIGRFLTAGLLDRLHISISPLIIGDGPTGISLPAVPLLRNCLRPAIRLYDLGGEFIFDCAFDPDSFRPAAEAWNGHANRS